MISTRSLPVLISCCVALIAGCGAKVPQQTLTIRDYTRRGFAPDMVRYELPANAATGPLRVTDSDGNALPIQVSDQGDHKLLHFVASLAPNATSTYTLDSEGPASPASTLSVSKSADAINISTALLKVRLPGERDVTFDKPVKASTLPAPILAYVSGADDRWLGSSRVLTDRLVKAFRVKVTQQGPVFVRVHYGIEWASGGYFKADVDVIDNVPVVKVREAFDLGELDGTDFWELSLSQGWSPDEWEAARVSGNGTGMDRGRVYGFDTLQRGPMRVIKPDQTHGGHTATVAGFSEKADREANPDSFRMVGIVPMHAGQWRRFNAVELHYTEADNSVVVRFPMTVRHQSWMVEVGSTTSPFSMQEHDPNLPVTEGRRVWGLALNHPKLPGADEAQITFGSQWHGRLNPWPMGMGPFMQARVLYGMFGLDTYKDFVLEWPETGVTHPRLYNRGRDVAQLREALDAAPLDASAKSSAKSESWIYTGDEKKIDALLKKAYANGVEYITNYLISCPGPSHHSISGLYVAAAQCDELLASGLLTDEQRTELRARIALAVYLYEHGDSMSLANGSHPGNPNMGTARYMSGIAFASLIPDHPMYDRWKQHMGDYARYRVGAQMAPGGGFFEYGSAYHMHGYARVTNVMPAIRNMEMPEYDTMLRHYHAPDWDYYMNLITPVDPMWKTRMIPGMANSPPGNEGHFIDAAGSLESDDPELAANLMWAWENNGRNLGGANTYLAPLTSKPKAPALKSQVYPGIGVILRAHVGTDGESYMLLRAGFQWSHWYNDPGHFIMYGRGVPLVPQQSYQYWGNPHKDFDAYNTVRMGHPENQWPYGWGDCNILDTYFSDSVDYAHASTGFPDWFIEPGVADEWLRQSNAPVEKGQHRMLDEKYEQKQGAVTWDRQVMLMKGKTPQSPTYFVIRDSFSGEGKLSSYINLALLGTKEHLKVEGNTMHVDAEGDIDMDVIFVGRDDLAVDSVEVRPDLVFYGGNYPQRVGKDQTAPRDWVNKKTGEHLTPPPTGWKRGEVGQQTTFNRIANKPGQDVFWVLFPRKTGEAKPKVERLADGVIKVTHAEGTDTVYMGPQPMQYGEGERRLVGMAGALREWKAGGVEKIQTAGPVRVPGAPQVPTVEKSEGGVTFTGPGETYYELTDGTRGVRGYGPFKLTFTDDKITGTVSGERRSLVVTWPNNIVRPGFWMDGVRFFAGWADDHSIGKGTDSPQFSIGFGVTKGDHEIEISEGTWPMLPPVAPMRTISAE